MRCAGCGNEYNENYRFCPICGSKLTDDADKQYKKKYFLSKTTIIIAIIAVLLITGIIASKINSAENTEGEELKGGQEIFADHSAVEDVAYNFTANLFLADLESDFETFCSTTTVNWQDIAEESGTLCDIAYSDYTESFVSDKAGDYEYFRIETVDITDLPYTYIHKNISLYSKLLRPLSVSAVKYIPFSDIRTLTDITFNVEFCNADNEVMHTQEITLTVAGVSDEYYAPRTYTVLKDSCFIEGFICSLYPENASTAIHTDGTEN